ncbi:hypothetical protein FEM48_Zijuj07G0031300 [Ziziphus jujuba var. spinosa]|uniref:Dihydroorotase n=1 Tax=Ziziphus jujuba var. spinosa TaxID=714518 RepID=A0A978V237_ZIZJJ|nr:hypothetical protein FEM48_Zijuj07G0031300 [Ziziphus jujuba var. spinosa]
MSPPPPSSPSGRFPFAKPLSSSAVTISLSIICDSQALKFSSAKFVGPRPRQLRYKGTMMELTITRPDDWHIHLRDGDLLEAVVPHR